MADTVTLADAVEHAAKEMRRVAERMDHAANELKAAAQELERLLEADRQQWWDPAR